MPFPSHSSSYEHAMELGLSLTSSPIALPDYTIEILVNGKKAEYSPLFSTRGKAIQWAELEHHRFIRAFGANYPIEIRVMFAGFPIHTTRPKKPQSLDDLFAALPH
jgi:hypothetical protein